MRVEWIERHWALLMVVGAMIYLSTMHLRPFAMDFALKAAPILLLALVCWLQLRGTVRILMTAALLLSATGDVLLAVEFSGSFTFGLGAFLCAQLLYTTVFIRRRQRWVKRVPLLLGLVVFYSLMVIYLLPRTGELLLPVTLYMTVITVMGATAVVYRGSSWVMLGALCFMVSDTVIALNKFWLTFELADMVIMNTYYLAQLMIVWGVLQTQRKAIV